MTIPDADPAPAEAIEETSPDPGDAGHALRGVLLIVVAVFLFACNDVTTKYLVTSYNVPLVGAVRYFVHLLLMLAILGPRHGKQLVRTRRTGLVIVRASCLVLASFFAGLALQRMPVAETLALVFLAPMILPFVAIPLLGERLGAVGWLAVAMGFVGMLLIVRPGSGLEPLGVVFALATAFVTTVYYLLSRILASSEKTIAMLFYVGLVGSIAFGLLLPWYWRGEPPGLVVTLLFLSMGVVSGVGHFLFTAAHRLAPASLLAPVNYLQLVWVGLLGWIVFDHVPDGLTIIGMSVIGASGVMIAVNSSRRSAS